MARLSKFEQETIIEYTQADEEARIVTHDRPLIRRLLNLGLIPEASERESGRVVSAEFTIPRSWIKVSPPRSASPGQRESARLTMEALNARRSEVRKNPRRRRPARKSG